MPSGSAPPAPATSLIGRAAEVEHVRELLRHSRLVTLTGPPGVGKTRLALEVCRQDLEGDRAVWLDLAPVRDPAQAQVEVSRALGQETAPDAHVLLVVDNCEHLLDPAGTDVASALAGLLAGSPHLRVLATSRERLRIGAEREWPVPPLPMPTERDVADLDALRRNPAVAMLLDRSPAAVRLTPGSARALADICIGLDGLPLAIELAAARLRMFTPSELAFRLERRMAVLTSGARDAPVRHQDLRAAVAWSHQLLADRERAVFRRLAVFPGSWTLEGAEEICGGPEVADAVESLLDKSLVRRADSSPDATRFTMLMSLREYALEQLEEHDEVTATRDRHVAWLARKAQDWEATVGTEGETGTWSELALYRADLWAAVGHGRTTGSAEATLWLAAALGWYAYTRGSLADATVPLGAISDALDASGTSRGAQAAAHLTAGVVGYALGDHESADHHLRVAEGDTGSRERRPAVARAFLGHVAREQGDLAGAASLYASARATYVELGNTRGIAWAGHDLALLALHEGRDDEGAALLRESAGLFDTLDYDWAVAVCACALAGVLVRRGTPGEVDEAAALVGRALRLHTAVGDRRGVAQSLEVLAEVALARGAVATSAQLVGAAGVRRDQASTPPTETDVRRLADLEARLRRALGGSADHERHAGRTMPADAVLALAERLVAVGPAEAKDVVELTPRQREVAALVAAGRTNRQIGRSLGISEKTTEIHVHNIMSRLGVPSRAGVAAWAATRGLDPVPDPAP